MAKKTTARKPRAKLPEVLEPPPFTEFVLRGREQSASTPGVVKVQGIDAVALFGELLDKTDYTAREPVISWDNKATLAALDIDIKAGMSWWSQYAANGELEYTRPRPCWTWVTHGGGLRGIYRPLGDLLTARQVALIAALNLPASMRRYIHAIEVKTDTRHPGYKRGSESAGMVHRYSGDSDIEAVRRYTIGFDDGGSEVDEATIADWLAEKGYVVGRRYGHERCPIDEDAKPIHGSDPVQVFPDGIYCFRCQKQAPMAKLVRGDGRIVADDATRPLVPVWLRNAVKNFTHWTHAKHIFAAKAPHVPERLRRETYEALLLLWHVPKCRKPKAEAAIREQIAAVFYDIAKVRVAGRWVDAADMASVFDGSMTDFVNSLPASRHVNAAGKVVAALHRRCDLSSTLNLGRIGYPNITPIRGVDFAPAVVQYDDADELRIVQPMRPPFKLLSAEEVEARRLAGEGAFRSQFPGCNLDLLRLLVGAKAFVQRLGGKQPPLIFVTGMSASGKTAHVMLAADLTGEHVHIIRGHNVNKGEEVERAYSRASSQSSYAVFDEVLKACKDRALLREFILNAGPNMQVRELYEGHKKIVQPAVIVMIDTGLPDDLINDDQFARRVIHVEMGTGAVGQADWRTKCIGGDVVGWRSLGGDFGASFLNQRTGDWLVSDVWHRVQRFIIDERDGGFHAYARSLGFSTLQERRNTSDGIDPREKYRTFFNRVCDMPDTKDGKFQGRGWKVFDTASKADSAVVEAWRALFREGASLTASWLRQELQGQQWPTLLGILDVQAPDVIIHGTRIGVRFRNGPARKPTTKFNAELLSGSLPGGCREVAPDSEPATP